MIIKLCAKCKKPVVYPDRFCKSCYEKYKTEIEENERLSDKRYNQARDKKYKNFYNSKSWNILKDKKMQDCNYKCERCKELGIKLNGKDVIATEVHHIKPIQTDEGWILRLEYSNLKCVCTDCHNYYHNRFQKKGR